MIKIKQSIFQIALFCFGAAALTAQPTLQNNVFPSVGNTVTSAEAEDPDAITEGAAGANITWNFSALQAASGTSFLSVFVAPATTPYAAQFPASNLASSNVTDTVYGYYQKSATEVQILGIASTDVLFDYTNPETVMKAPLSLNGTFTDTFRGDLDLGGFLVTTSGERESQYDAYGTLFLPSGSYNNAMRVKTTSTQNDTLDFVGVLNITQLNFTTYEWFAANNPGPLVSITYSEGTSTSVIPGQPPIVEPILPEKSVNYTTALNTGLVEVPELDGNLVFRGANPVADVLALDITSATTGETLQLQVYGRNGQLVSSQNITTNGATLSVDVNVTDCRSGLYFVSLTDGKARLSKGFVKM